MCTSTSCVYSCVCMSAKLSTFQKQTIYQALCIVSIEPWALAGQKTQTIIFFTGCFYKLVSFQYFVAHLSLLEWLLPPKRVRGRSTIIWAWKAITDWEAITDWTRHWQQILGHCWEGQMDVSQVQLLLDNYNNWRGSGNIIREKSGEFRFKWDELISEKSRSR